MSHGLPIFSLPCGKVNLMGNLEDINLIQWFSDVEVVEEPRPHSILRIKIWQDVYHIKASLGHLGA
jgi:hypothetical protein